MAEDTSATVRDRLCDRAVQPAGGRPMLRRAVRETSAQEARHGIHRRQRRSGAGKDAGSPGVAQKVLQPVGLAAMFFTREIEDARPARNRPEASRTAPLRLILILSVVNLMVMGSIRSTQIFFSHYLDARLGVPTLLIGRAAAVARPFSVPSALLMPFLADRIGRPATLLASIGLLALSQLALASRGARRSARAQPPLVVDGSRNCVFTVTGRPGASRARPEGVGDTPQSRRRRRVPWVFRNEFAGSKRTRVRTR
jgi:hypothetical protein